ncbi:MAG: recombinase family protein [Chloroflexi bacterium]|nr:recombinase family protein [Chloroflexota bacterium]
MSTKDQSENNLSLPLQAEVTMDFIDQQGGQLSSHRGNTNVHGLWYDPGVSAWKTPLFERPGFRKMWAKMRAGDVIVMLSLDRGWRSVQDFLICYKEFLKYGIEVRFARGQIGFGGEHDTPMTRFILTGEANIAELKSELVSERTREGWKARKKAAGSVAACEAAAETGVTCGKTVKPIRYRETEGNDWGAAYRMLRDRRQDIEVTAGRVFGYVRVSTSDQSVVSQKQIVDESVKKFCRDTGYPEQHTFVDHGVSAFKVDWSLRPEGSKLWAQFQKGDHVHILCADRAFRSIKDMAGAMQDLEDRGVILHFIRDGIRTDQGSGMRLLQSLAMAAQWEWEDQSSRIRLSMEKHREKFGVWIGPHTPRWLTRLSGAIPYGLQLVVDHGELDRMIQINEMINNRGKTTWGNLTREVEQAMAERDGRRPIPIHGASLQKHRLKSTPAERLSLRVMIRRKTRSLTPALLNQGWKKTKEIHPEIGTEGLINWKRQTWSKLVDYVSVKPEIFGDARDRIMEMA